MFLREISIIILIYRKLGSVGPVQRKIKLPSPDGLHIVSGLKKMSFSQQMCDTEFL